MKILISGTAGFIGNALAKRLLERGDEVVGVDITELKTDVGYEPTTPVEVGVARFIEWYCDYYHQGRAPETRTDTENGVRIAW